MKTRKSNYGVANLLATFYAVAIVCVPAGLFFGLTQPMGQGSTPEFLLIGTNVAIFTTLFLGIPTEFFWVSRMKEPTLRRAYGAYLATGGFVAFVAAVIVSVMTSKGNYYVSPAIGPLVAYIVYIPAMLITRAVYQKVLPPTIRALAKRKSAKN